MDADMVKRHLAQAEKHLALGARLVAEQRERVAKLERLGANCVQAKRLLTLFEELQAMHIRHREIVMAELTATQEAPPAVWRSGAERAAPHLPRWPKRFADDVILPA